MFNFQGSELIIILLLALVVLGPEKLPEAMRKMGQAYSELRKMSSTFQQEFKSVVDEPVREIRETADLIRESADFKSFADGTRAEKPKSAEMSALDGTEREQSAAGDPAAEPAAEPTVGSPEMVSEPELEEPAQRLPFEGESSLEISGSIERIESGPSSGTPAPPPPFTPSGGVVGNGPDVTSDDDERSA